MSEGKENALANRLVETTMFFGPYKRLDIAPLLFGSESLVIVLVKDRLNLLGKCRENDDARREEEEEEEENDDDDGDDDNEAKKRRRLLL
jgi:hypothetical protein